jgi:microcystin-dependent protein
MKKIIIVIISVVFLSAGAVLAQDREEITLTTYYPAPYGDYDELRLSPHNTPSSADGKAGNIYYDETENQLKISDGTNYVNVGAGDGVPAGMIAAFPVEIIPSGWLACNGQSVSKVDYSELYDFLKNKTSSCIYGETATHFTLPDYRGYFLRGWDGASGRDPDAVTRTDAGGTTTVGDEIGSVQRDIFRAHSHVHKFRRYPNATGSQEQAYPTKISTVGGSAIKVQSPSGEETGGSETRPINIYVMYCIKT